MSGASGWCWSQAGRRLINYLVRGSRELSPVLPAPGATPLPGLDIGQVTGLPYSWQTPPEQLKIQASCYFPFSLKNTIFLSNTGCWGNADCV